MNDNNKEKLLLAEAADYFRSRPGLGRILSELVAKYRSLGRLGGAVVLDNITSLEKVELESFFRKRLPDGTWSVSAQAFAKALAETKFGTLEPVDILAAWQGEPLDSRKRQQELKEQARHDLLISLMSEHPHTFCQQWLKAILAKEPDTRQVQAAIRRDKHFRQNIKLALQALEQLPQNYLRLPVFARKVCGNPHALDIDGIPGKLFLNGLRYIRANSESHSAGMAEDEDISAIEEISELLYTFLLLREDIMNYVTCIGLAAFDQEQELAYWRVASQAGAPLNVPLREIVRAAHFYPAALSLKRWPCCHAEGFKVFLVENSGVFSALLDELELGGQNKGEIPLVCLQGQLKMAAWTLVDGLVNSGAVLYYSGDFDPEGLRIAEKLLLRYPGRVHLWRMNPESYFQAKPTIPLDPLRLSKLNSIKAPELVVLAETIARTELAAYQEGILEKLAADLLGKSN